MNINIILKGDGAEGKLTDVLKSQPAGKNVCGGLNPPEVLSFKG